LRDTLLRLIAARGSAMLMRMGILGRAMLIVGGAANRAASAALVATLLTLIMTPLAAESHELTGFGSNPGNLRMYTYIPTGLPDGAPMVVLLHGCKQRAESFARDSGFVALAERQKFVLLLPEQKGPPPYLYDIYLFDWMLAWFGVNNQNACFNWFEPHDATRESGEAQSIRQMMDFMIERHAVDRSRVYVAGLSAGGAMTAALLAAYPERFAGGAIVAGVPYGCANTVWDALHCMDPGIDRTPAQWARIVRDAAPAETKFPPLSIWHGGNDIRVVPSNRRELVEQWSAVHGIATSPAHAERSGHLTRERYSDGTSTQVESVLVERLGHAFPIHSGGPLPCGRPGDFVVEASVCAAAEILRFWGLLAGN
jgi:poly(hydroxyalkanoate) depolymerase family esterase